MATTMHERLGVGLSIEQLPDGRRKVTVIDAAKELDGVTVSFIVPNRKNWVALLGRAIVRVDYYEKVFKSLARGQRRASRGPASTTRAPKANPSVAILRLVK